MKVNVLTVNDINIPIWRWWSNWIDIAVFSYGGYGYLLQMRISRRNAKQFNARPMKWLVAHAKAEEVGDLVQMRVTKP